MSDEVKVAMVGSRDWDNFNMVRRSLDELKKKFGDNLVVVSGGARRGADKIVKWIITHDKKYMDITYREFPPAHFEWNDFCVKGKENYGKPYDVSNYFERNREIAEYCEYCVAFLVHKDDDEKDRGTKNTLKQFYELDKRTLELT